MIKKLVASVISLMAISAFLSAGVDYEIKDIGILQTHSSEAIDINNKGQILGWYNIKGANDGKQFFVQNKNGEFFELPKNTPENRPITWKYLTDKAYGTFDVNGATICLCAWDEKNGFVKLGNLPGKEISAINDVGQVLVKSITETREGKTFVFPVIWQNGSITKLRGLEGDLGIEGEEAYGFDMNNKGDVVGQSTVYMSYKNDIYRQIHATKWANGKAIDLYKKVPKSAQSTAKLINDLGDIYIIIGNNNSDGQVLQNDEIKLKNWSGFTKLNNNNYLYYNALIYDRNSIDNRIFVTEDFNNNLSKDYSSIWLKILKIINVNENGEAIALGETVYGEKHAMRLVPVKK